MNVDVQAAGDLALLTIARASALIRAKKISPVDISVAAFRRIRALDDRLKSHIVVLEEQGMAAARAAEKEIAAGDWRGPLHGIPIGLKDIYNTAGIATTGHSALFRDHVPTQDATSVRKLREAGAIFTGKLSTWEFAIGGTSFDLPWPPARNPWNLDHDPSGSSSGSGAAVAAGLCLGAMGSDTGGSIRGPAAWCGIAGHKPSYGLVSKAGVLPLSFGLDHAGPMCWTAEDCALMMAALAGYDPEDASSADVPIPDFSDMTSPITGLRVGVVRHFFETDLPCEENVAAAFAESLKVLTSLGAAVRDVTIAPFSVYGAAAGQISRAEAYSIHEYWLQNSPEKYGALGRQRLMAGAFVRGVDYVNAQRERARLVAGLTETMRDVDVLVFPTARKVAPKLGVDRTPGGSFYNRAFNLTGSPALSVCNGFSADGLPTALQIVGRPFEDPLVLRVGAAYERATGWRDRRPPIAHMA
jgi:aspartyl-tRNA(Asn)/glutamyl-tRNA(Gln) amidotransferase subunit A